MQQELLQRLMLYQLARGCQQQHCSSLDTCPAVYSLLAAMAWPLSADSCLGNGAAQGPCLQVAAVASQQHMPQLVSSWLQLRLLCSKQMQHTSTPHPAAQPACMASFHLQTAAAAAPPSCSSVSALMIDTVAPLLAVSRHRCRAAAVVVAAAAGMGCSLLLQRSMQDNHDSCLLRQPCSQLTTCVTNPAQHNTTR
jgi:hypothetical protein